MTSYALLDPARRPQRKDGPFHNSVIVRNHHSVFYDYDEGVEEDLLAEDELEEDPEQEPGRKDADIACINEIL